MNNDDNSAVLFRGHSASSVAGPPSCVETSLNVTDRAGQERVPELLDEVERHTGRQFDPNGAKSLTRPDFKAEVSDAAAVILLPGTGGEQDAILSLSPPDFPESVADAVMRSTRVRAALPARLASNVLLPQIEGRHEGRSYALYPRLRPFSKNRGICRVQKVLMRGQVRDWLCEVAATTRREAIESEELNRCFLSPLDQLCGQIGASAGMRSAAGSARDAFASGELRPVTVVQHSDFWLGNILMQSLVSPLQKRYAFSVIDWGASLVQGYPMLDLMRFSLSVTRSERWTVAAIENYAEAADLPREALLPHLLAGIGWLGENRECFPLDRYLQSSERLYEAASHYTEKISGNV